MSLTEAQRAVVPGWAHKVDLSTLDLELWQEAVLERRPNVLVGGERGAA